MSESIVYVEADDEITGVIARMRRLEAGPAVLVLPAGSRIATSRINFRLLAREGEERGKQVIVVSDEPGARALATSAGLPAYATLAAAEEALVSRGEGDEQPAARFGRDAIRGSAPDEATRVMAAAPTTGRKRTRPMATPGTASAATRAGAGSLAPAPALEAQPSRPSAGRRSRLLPLIAALLLVLVVAGVGYAAYVFLPTAEVTIRPHVTLLGPHEFRIVADPGVAVPDAATGVVPAEVVTATVTVTRSFAATGEDLRQSRATGVVRFRSENTVFEVPVPEGTVVATPDGVEFETTESVTLEQASFASGPTSADVPVRAVRPGPRGNVEAEMITRLPESLEAAQVSVRNPEPTSGGRREEVTVVTQADYDAAAEALAAELPAELARVLAQPSTTPRGLTLFRASADLGPPAVEPAADAVVDTEAAQFILTMQATATATAVNEEMVDELAREALAAQVPPDASLAGPVVVEREYGTVVGDTVAYTATARAEAYRQPDQAELLERLRGRPVSEAEAIMAQYGTAELTVWPEFVDRLPDQTTRISLTILPPRETR